MDDKNCQLQGRVFAFTSILQGYGLRVSANKSNTMAFIGEVYIATALRQEKKRRNHIVVRNYYIII